MVPRHGDDGEVDLVVELPGSQVTSCCFGGAALDTLYVSTARENFPPERRSAEPTAGSLFRVRTGHHGRRSRVCPTGAGS